jgi:UDP-N-acetylglucosamine 2-epimerase (non-hydrolysing)
MTPHVCIATGTRADWGLLRPIAAALRDSGRVKVSILATNMHLMQRYGHTIDEIIADGFDIDARVEMPDTADTPAGRATAMGTCLSATARVLDQLKPDAMIILGDRYEMLAIASAAAVMCIPIVHIAGGEVSEGAVDDCLRHAITKLSTLHLTATEPYRRRVIQMGEAPDRVVNTGAIGVWNLRNFTPVSRAELLDSVGLDSDRPFAVVTYHPATLDHADPTEHFTALLAALDRFPELNVIITYPNNDARSLGIITAIEAYAAAHPARVAAVKSLGMRRYLSAISEAVVVIGNSSSGLVEVPSAGTPTVDIGMRQQGRTAGESVIHCDEGSDAIATAIAKALSPEMQALAATRRNPYAKPDTLDIMIDAITKFLSTLPQRPKRFYDLP